MLQQTLFCTNLTILDWENNSRLLGYKFSQTSPENSGQLVALYKITYWLVQSFHKPLITKKITCHVHITIIHQNTLLKYRNTFVQKMSLPAFKKHFKKIFLLLLSGEKVTFCLLSCTYSHFGNLFYSERKEFVLNGQENSRKQTAGKKKMEP